ncbi:PREDICTED: histamine H3 receptor [Condylura cristata]|uniref:histamine H3 receptor n=1 Tax=Condylura cristata TaxID=143302 RepID=UPI000642E7B7|nr:PREDICTED: histamine H3 receptor [Condylura cristata]
MGPEATREGSRTRHPAEATLGGASRAHAAPPGRPSGEEERGPWLSLGPLPCPGTGDQGQPGGQVPAALRTQAGLALGQVLALGSPTPGTLGRGFSAAWTALLAALMALLIVATVLGNALVMLAFVADSSLRTQNNFFLLNLAISDFLVGAFCIPLYVPYVLTGRWPFGRGLCKLWLVVDYLLCTSSVFNIVLISYDRFLSVTRAVSPGGGSGSSSRGAERPRSLKRGSRPSAASGSLEKRVKMVSQSVAQRFRLSRDKKVAKSLAVIVGVFGLCWAPYTLLMIIRAACHGRCVPDYWYEASFWLLWANSAVNPVLYPLCHHSFRRAFAKLLCPQRLKVQPHGSLERCWNATCPPEP